MDNTHSLSKLEKDTYDAVTDTDKLSIPEQDVLKHWKARAARPGLQSVMSARHTIDANIEATRLLKEDMFDFLKGYLENRRVYELGVGIGRMTQELAKRASEVYGNDISSEMLARAAENLRPYDNVTLRHGKIYEMNVEPGSFDLAFESIVLLHILDPEELRKTAEAMRKLSRKVFLCEHTYEGPDFPISKYTLLRKPEEYQELFKPYTLVKQREHRCAGDRFTFMLFEEK